MTTKIDEMINIISQHNGINDKHQLADTVSKSLFLTKDRSVYYCNEFAIRFSQAKTNSFSNTVLALSNLQKYDSMPFFVCVVYQQVNNILISNSTFLKKISHSSQELSTINIKGSFNGSDIMMTFNSISNTPENFNRLFLIHESIGFQGNLERLVDSTNSIIGTGHSFYISELHRNIIYDAPDRAIKFSESTDYSSLKYELDEIVERNKHAILIASLIPNVNIRGRVIEYLIAGEDEQLREELIKALVENHSGLPRFATENSLGDYTKEFFSYHTETDIKTKVMALESNPKAYNIDKMLEFLSTEKSVFMFYFIGIDPGMIFNKALVSMFENRLANGTLLLRHWAGRNSRGVTQLEGKAIREIIMCPGNIINKYRATSLIDEMINGA